MLSQVKCMKLGNSSELGSDQTPILECGSGEPLGEPSHEHEDGSTSNPECGSSEPGYVHRDLRETTHECCKAEPNNMYEEGNMVKDGRAPS